MFTDYNAIEMLKHFSESFPSIQKFIIHFAYLLGVFAAGYGVHGFMTSGRMLSSNPERKHTYTWSVIIGSVLMSITTAVSTFYGTLFASNDPAQVLSFVESDDPHDITVKVATAWVIMIGWIANIYGLWLIKTPGPSGYSNVQRGIVHIIGGTMAIGITKLARIIGSSLGILPLIDKILK